MDSSSGFDFTSSLSSLPLARDFDGDSVIGRLSTAVSLIGDSVRSLEEVGPISSQYPLLGSTILQQLGAALSFFTQDKLYLLLGFYLFLPSVFGRRGFDIEKTLYLRSPASKERCKQVMCLYNLVMSAFSLWSFLATFWVVFVQGLPEGIFGKRHTEEPSQLLENPLIHHFYLSKYVEFLDTFFLVLIGRPVSWLQYIHHIGAPLVMGSWYHYKVPGIWFFVCWNGFIHTIMYYYYACCIMKWRFFGPKKYLTQMQLVQFFVGLAYCLGMQWKGDVYECAEMKFCARLLVGYLLLLITLFSNFYAQSYRTKRPATRAAAAASTTATTAAANTCSEGPEPPALPMADARTGVVTTSTLPVSSLPSKLVEAETTFRCRLVTDAAAAKVAGLAQASKSAGLGG